MASTRYTFPDSRLSRSFGAKLTSDDIQSQPEVTKDLQTLSVEKTFDQLHKQENPVSTFFDELDDVTQRLVFKQLWDENRRLREVESQATIFKRLCPDTDRHLWAKRHGPGGGSNVLLKEVFREWAVDYGQEEDEEGTYEGGTMRKKPDIRDGAVTWSPMVCRFVRATPTSPLKLCYGPGRISDSLPDGHHMKCTCEDHQENEVYPWDIISSQLLLYRLVSVFELFPTKEGVGCDSIDGYKTCWGVSLIYRGDENWCSTLVLEDSKGGSSIKFEGTVEASEKALVLLNFLVSDACPLSYGGIVAGTIA